jgi:hypothetical protein
MTVTRIVTGGGDMPEGAQMARQMLDIAAPENGVEVEIRNDGQVLWVHVDGATVLRICRIAAGLIHIEDRRS